MEYDLKNQFYESKINLTIPSKKLEFDLNKQFKKWHITVIGNYHWSCVYPSCNKQSMENYGWIVEGTWIMESFKVNQWESMFFYRNTANKIRTIGHVTDARHLGSLWTSKFEAKNILLLPGTLRDCLRDTCNPFAVDILNFCSSEMISLYTCHFLANWSILGWSRYGANKYSLNFLW